MMLTQLANVSAAKETQPDRIQELLVKQVTATVRWRECVQAMTALGVDSFGESGPGPAVFEHFGLTPAGLTALVLRELAALLKRDKVDAVLLSPV